LPAILSLRQRTALTDSVVTQTYTLSTALGRTSPTSRCRKFQRAFHLLLCRAAVFIQT